MHLWIDSNTLVFYAKASISKCACCGRCLEPSLTDIEIHVRVLPSLWLVRIADAERWVDQVKAIEWTESKHVLAATKMPCDNKQDAVEELLRHLADRCRTMK
jgi:hypothetical protein